MDANLDCLVLGYHDVELDRIAAESYSMREWSGAYENVRANSVIFDGQRISYMDLLNKVLEASRGANPGLHVARMPSLGAWYLASFLRKAGYRAEIVNFFSHERARCAQLLRENPRAVAITTTFYVDPTPIKEIVHFIRQTNSSVRVIIGGPYVFNACEQYSTQPELLADLLRDTGADIIIVDSQGELTLSRVISHLRGDRYANETHVAVATRRSRSNSLTPVTSPAHASPTDDLHTIPNLLFFESQQLVRTQRVVESNDMNVFSEDWSAVAAEHFIPTVVTRTARSCAFSCAFCRYPIMAGPLNLKSLETIEQQFDLFQGRGVKQVVIIDDTFNVPLPRFKQLCKMLIRNRYDFEWFAYFRAANADPACFDLMAESRCGGVFLGIESGDQSILDNMHKSSRVDRYSNAIKELNRRGIITFASLIVGFPGETPQTVQNTIRFLQDAQPLYYRAELYYHSTNTPIQQHAHELGICSAGYSWRHNTMTWKEACEQTRLIYKSVKESKILPLHNFDFWSIPYLLGTGLSREQIHRFVSAAGEILLAGLDGPGPDAQGELTRLASTVAAERARIRLDLNTAR
jgi:radical SAM superfamily enzyme YgiQ (UPF0313 family)